MWLRSAPLLPRVLRPRTGFLRSSLFSPSSRFL
ncbi:hypothetical protein Patl1_36844 [Pistacia atlantica]|nr:hypothetical protein Patl1_36844 [Pistacia atlantica]